MTNRFELSFKNKEVRMWIYIMIPTAILGFSILIFADSAYQYLSSLVLLSAWIIYYAWRFQYRKKKTDSNQ